MMPYGPERCTRPEAVAAEKARLNVWLRKAECKAAEAYNGSGQEIIGESGMGDRFYRTFGLSVTKDNKRLATIAKAMQIALRISC